MQRNAAEILQPGEIITQDGRIVGRHNGLANYTIGQRKGLGASSSMPLYVITKNAAANQLVVGGREELGFHELTARDVNWVSGEAPSQPLAALVKIRYTAKEVEGLVTPLAENRLRVEFSAPVRDVTSGQAVVIYSGEEMLGGGIIT